MKRLSARNIALLAVCAAVLIAGQYVLSFLPNVEIVTLLIMVYTKRLRYRTLYVVYVFALVEGLIYGFHIWWICYLYIWTILFFVTLLLKDCESPVILACVAGAYGFVFGALSALPYLVTLGGAGFVSYVIAGLSFDLIHGAANFIIVLLLYKPLSRAFRLACPADLQQPFCDETATSPPPQ